MTNTATASLEVSPQHTAVSVGSGDVPVLATPWLIALCEQSTVLAVADLLSPGETTVGIRVDIEHLGASAVGATITAHAEVAGTDGHRIVCDVLAREGSRLVGRGTITRARVDRNRFISGVPAP